jgi:hypothetical protein
LLTDRLLLNCGILRKARTDEHPERPLFAAASGVSAF